MKKEQKEKLILRQEFDIQQIKNRIEARNKMVTFENTKDQETIDGLELQCEALKKLK